MEMLGNEITQLEATLMSKIGVVKCVETRLENRIYRPGSEFCKDDVELGLKKEALQLKKTEENLIKMIEHAKYVSYIANYYMDSIRWEKVRGDFPIRRH